MNIHYDRLSYLYSYNLTYYFFLNRRSEIYFMKEEEIGELVIIIDIFSLYIDSYHIY